ncbi:hypothetical protein K431DRAFT_46973 [Polychaeton citri CBS 116435]|uniref:Uncharacterized protein n=1 Tax=Polychaeton citri CBS 116435 TaxID=1314669 RepID=A0A9P4QCI2_9PEZI|nr:hypothetical protein K431DRAFT_46973 [Polychaeton citri CBS 116435]
MSTSILRQHRHCCNLFKLQPLITFVVVLLHQGGCGALRCFFSTSLLLFTRNQLFFVLLQRNGSKKAFRYIKVCTHNCFLASSHPAASIGEKGGSLILYMFSRRDTRSTLPTWIGHWDRREDLHG